MYNFFICVFILARFASCKKCLGEIGYFLFPWTYHMPFDDFDG